MATNYGDTIFEDSLTPDVPIVQPVDNKAGEYLASGLAGTINNVNSLIFNPNAKAARAESAKNSVFADYAEEVSLIADAKDQGMSTDEAQRRLRVKQNEFLGNYPELADDFFTFSNKLMTENGFGGAIHKETPLETANRKKIETATADGWDVSTKEGMAAYDRFKNNSAYLEQLQQNVDMTLAAGKQITAQTQAEATVALHDLVSSTVPWVNNLIATTTTALKGVSDPVQRQALIDQAKAKYGQQAALLGNLRSQSQNAIDTSYLTAATDQLMATFEEVATGKSDLAALTTANELAQAKANAIVFVDPKVAALIALDKASKFSDPNAIRALDQVKLDLWGRLNSDGNVEKPDKPPDVVDKAENVALVFDELKKGTTALVNDKTADPEAKAAQSNKIVNTLRSIVTYGTSDQDATNFTSVVDFLADPSVGKFMEQNKDAINPEIADQAKYVTQQQYDNVVLPLINERWLEAQTQIMQGQSNMTTSDMFNTGAGLSAGGISSVENIDISKAIEPVWNGAGIEFKVTDEFKGNAQVRAVAKDLNAGPNAIAPALNKLVRLSAHLSGNTDYKKAYDEAYASRLWQGAEDTEQDAGKQLDKLTNIPEAALKGPVLQPIPPVDWEGTAPTTSVKGEAGGLLDAIGEAEGATYNTLYGYAEREGGDFAGTDITKMTIGDVMRLQRQMVSANGVSSAVGKYQFIQDTLKEAVAGVGLSPADVFSPANQDKLALWLLRQRTDFDDWVTGQADPAEFQNQLAGIWASVPNTSGKSAYASDGLNKASSKGKKLVGML
jgi:hypothetical protein